MEKKKVDLHFLSLLADKYPSVNEACTEIINLKAILNLPKGTEHFVSDIHGEAEAFRHVLKNASGVIKDYIEEIYGNSMSKREKQMLATLIYYPDEKIRYVIANDADGDISDWYKVNLFRLVRICKRTSSKYTRSKVRKALPKEFAYILEELIHEDSDRIHKQEYYQEIIDTIIALGRAPAFIAAISNLIQRLAIDHLHVIGDIYDRGKSADIVMDVLEGYHSVDIQWGNHDIAWMGAAAGSDALLCSVIRLCARYDNLHTLEEGYGINLVPLATFAMEMYRKDPCTRFYPETKDGFSQTEKELSLLSKMHKAITVMQFKLEHALVARCPEFEMEQQDCLTRVDFEKGIYTVDGNSYPLIDTMFPTIDPTNPTALTAEESDVLAKIHASVAHCHKLQRHVRFLFNRGNMYKIHNENLLYHGCVPMTESGELRQATICGKRLQGKQLFDTIEAQIRKGYFATPDSKDRRRAQDLMWYLWCGKDSPLYGKNKMATFERYFLEAKELWVEDKDPYYAYQDSEAAVDLILNDFKLNVQRAKIINGHVPVQVRKGETPVKAGGKLFVIDGGFARAYQKVTGTAGYTLISNSKGLMLTCHSPAQATSAMIEQEFDIISNTAYSERAPRLRQVADTDVGRKIKTRIEDLQQLVEAYGNGTLQEQQ